MKSLNYDKKREIISISIEKQTCYKFTFATLQITEGGIKVNEENDSLPGYLWFLLHRESKPENGSQTSERFWTPSAARKKFKYIFHPQINDNYFHQGEILVKHLKIISAALKKYFWIQFSRVLDFINNNNIAFM